MYEAKTVAGRGFAVLYPRFTGEGTDTINDFYETLAGFAVGHFKEILDKDRRTVCRCNFQVDSPEDSNIFAVTVRLALRKGGKRQGEKMLVHRWKKIRGEWLAVMGKKG